MTLGKGWKPDTADHIAECPKLGALAAKDRYGARAGAALPSEVNLLREHCQIRDQRGSSACFGFALTGAAYARLRHLGVEVSLFSPLGAYAIARQMEGIYHGKPLPDDGSYPYLGMRGAARFGLIPESRWPFDADWQSKVSLEVPFDILQIASQVRVANFARIDAVGAARIDVCKAALAKGHPVLLGMQVGSEFERYHKGRGPVGIETGDVGGHATFLVGYEEDGDVFVGCNSWGEAWGDEGFYRVHRSKIEHESTDSLYDFVLAEAPR